MKQPVAIVTDSSCGLPADVLGRLGIMAAAGTVAFERDTLSERQLDATEFYERMRHEVACPRPFGVPEEAWREAFRCAREVASSVLCLVAPFDVLPSYTTAGAAISAISAMDAGDVKLVNPGIASAGLGGLLLSLAPLAHAGAAMDELLDAIDLMESGCDVLVVPREVCWLERSGKLALIEERLGPLAGRSPVIRVSTRFTGVAACDGLREAVEEAIARVGQRADPYEVNVVVTHAANPEMAAWTAEKMTERWKPANIVIGELGPTIGSQLGPGAIGIGVAPAKLEQL